MSHFAACSDVVKARHARQMEKYATKFTADPATWEGKCVVSVKQFDLDAMNKLFQVADTMKQLVKDSGGDTRLKGKILATLFYENSTRTCCSLQAAMTRLGGGVLSVNEATSSVKKGETLQDTISCLCSYADVIALRHPVEGAAAQAVTAARKPILNAGDGVGEHPTQALLDVYTIFTELGAVQGKVITMLGDLKNGRTVHSLARVLAMYDCELHFVSPPSLRMPEDVLRDVAAAGGGARVRQSDGFDDVIGRTDVLYVTRVQGERFADPAEYERLKLVYRITPEVLARAKADMILLHPLPRVGEISEDCDDDPRCAFVRQMENGMLIRMALLALIMGKS